MAFHRRSTSRLSTISTTTASTYRTRDSLSSPTRSSTSSLSSVGESIAVEQRPQLSGPALKTPSYPHENGTISMVCATTIEAPLETVTALLLDARTYSTWNRFCPAVTVTHQPSSTAPLPACVRNTPELEDIENLHTTLRDGTVFTMHIDFYPGNTPKKRKTTPSLQVSALEQFERDGKTGVRLAWRIKGRVATFLAKSERVQEFVQTKTPDGRDVVEYACWETYYGMLATSMKNNYETELKVGYSAWMDGLKVHAEKLAEMKSREEGI